MDTFYTLTVGTEARRMPDYSFELEYIVGNQNSPDAAYPVVEYSDQIPYENVSLYEEINNFQPNSMQSPRRAEEVMSSGNNFCGDLRSPLGNPSSWFPDKLPFINDSVRETKPIVCSQNDFVDDSGPQNYQELTAVATENLNTFDVVAIYDVNKFNETGLAPSQENSFDDSKPLYCQELTAVATENINISDVGAIYEVKEENEPGLARSQENILDDLSLESLLNDDSLGEHLNRLTNPMDALIVLNEDSDPLPRLEEGLPMNLIDFLTTNDPRPSVSAEAAAPEPQTQVSEPQVEVPQKRRRGRPPKNATTQKTSVQKNLGGTQYDAEFSLIPYGKERKAKQTCQAKMRTSMSEEDTTGSSSDQDYIPETSGYPTSKRMRKVSRVLQDDCCSSTSESADNCEFYKKKKNNAASKKSRDKKKEYYKSVEKTCDELQMRNDRLRLKAAKVQEAFEYILKVLNPEHNQNQVLLVQPSRIQL